MHHGVVRYRRNELSLLRWIWQLTMQQQITGFQEIAIHRKLFDRVAAIKQLALIAIDVGDGGITSSGRHEAGVVGEHPRRAV